MLVNNAPLAPSVEKRYRAQRSEPVAVRREQLEPLRVQVVEGNFVSGKRSFPAAARRIRHDSQKLAKAVLEVTANHKYWGDAETPPATAEQPSIRPLERDDRK
jgi:hypothetical protein